MMKDKKAAARVARVEMLANNEAKKVIAEKKRSD